jgi:hypothetical protein
MRKWLTVAILLITVSAMFLKCQFSGQSLIYSAPNLHSEMVCKTVFGSP